MVLCLPDCPSPLTSLPFLNCLPSVTRSVTSPVIPPCVCKSWLFVLKHVNLVEVCRLFFPLKKQNKTKHFSGVERWEGRIPDDPPLGASPPPHLPHQTSCIHPFIHPLDIHPSVDDSDDQDWNHQSGLLEEAMVMRRAVVLCRRCSGWETLMRLRHLASDFAVKLKSASAEADSGLATTSLFTHRYTHIGYRHEHLTQVQM